MNINPITLSNNIKARILDLMDDEYRQKFISPISPDPIVSNVFDLTDSGHIADPLVPTRNTIYHKNNESELKNALKVILDSVAESVAYEIANEFDDNLYYQDPIKEFFDPTLNLPVDPEVGDRYIAVLTANGWTINHIYEWNYNDADSTEPEWIDKNPTDEVGIIAWIIAFNNYYVYDNNLEWIEITELLTNLSFTDLDDTPSTYVGSAGKLLAVNATSDAVEFIALPPHNILSISHSDTLVDSIVDGDILIGNASSKLSRLAISIPVTGVRNILGIDYGELRPSWKTALDSTNPVSIAVGDSASPGTSLVFAHRDHKHASPATWTPSSHNQAESTITFTDITTGDVSSSYHGYTQKAVVPAAGTLNYLGINNGETISSWKSASAAPGASASILQTTTAGLLTLQNLTIVSFGTSGVVHNSAAGVLSTSSIINSDLGVICTVGTIPKGATTGLVDSIITETITGIGIGVAVPNNKLQVSGLINFDDTLKNVLLGTNSGLGITTAVENVYIGGNAGKGNIDVGYNVGIGYKALELNESSSNNVAIGAYALSKLLSHLNNYGNNVALGAYALQNNISSYNIGIGAYVLNLTDNLSATGNIGIGYSSLYCNRGGYGNLGLGYAALLNNISGFYNLAIGFESLYTQTSNSANVSIGYTAMHNATGDGNIALGTGTLYSAVNSQSNIAIGYYALANASNSQSNIAIGYYAAYSTLAGSYNVFTGYQAAYLNQSNSYSTAIGYQALYSNISGGINTVVGSLAFYSNTGGGNVGLGLYAGYYETGSNKLFIDNSTRASEADGRIKALIYGVFNAATASQEFHVNAKSYFLEDMLIRGASKILFRDSDIGIYSQADGYGDLYADIGWRFGNSKSGAPASYAQFNSKGHLQLAVGTTSPGEAPLLFIAGALQSAPVAGSVEFDGTGMYITNTNHRRFISLASDSIISTVTATTVAPTTVWIGITNANELKSHRVYHIIGCGVINTHVAGHQYTVTINFGSTVVCTILTPFAKMTAQPWDFDVYVTIRATGNIATGIVSAFGHLELPSATVHTITEALATDTTVANDITVKIALDGTDTDNWMSLTQCWMETND